MSRRTAGLPGAPLAPPPRRVAARDNVAGPAGPAGLAGLDVHQLLAAEMREELRAERAAAERAARAAAERPRPSASRKDRDVDVHELLVGELRGERAETRALREEREELSLPDPTDVYGVSDQYLVLDSWHKVASSRVDQGEFAFNFMIQGVTGDQVIGVRDRIDNVIQIQIGSFAFPQVMDVPYLPNSTDIAPIPPPVEISPGYVLVQNNDNNTTLDPITGGRPPLLVSNTFVAPIYGQYPTSVLTGPIGSIVPWVANPYSQTPFGNRITIQIKEAGLQSFSDADGSRHHFEHCLITSFFAGGNPNMLTAVPACGGVWDTFTFTDPLKDLHGATLKFRGVDNPIAFLPDVYLSMTIKFALGGLNQPNPILPDAGLCVGDRVFFRKFTTYQDESNPGDPVIDAYINRVEGFVLNYGEIEQLGGAIVYGTPGEYIKTSAITCLDPGLTLTAAITNNLSKGEYTADMYIAKRRLRIPIRVRRVVDRRTNYISP